MITYPHHPDYIVRTIVGTVHSEFIKGSIAPYVHNFNGDVLVMIFKYNECSPFKYEVIARNGLVLRFGGEAAYPQLPNDVEVTIGMVDNYPYDGRKVSTPTHESWQSFCHTQRMGLWTDGHYGLKRLLTTDEFVRDVGCLIETVNLLPTVLKVYSIRMKVDQLKEIEHGYPRSQGESKSEENPT